MAFDDVERYLCGKVCRPCSGAISKVDHWESSVVLMLKSSAYMNAGAFLLCRILEKSSVMPEGHS